MTAVAADIADYPFKAARREGSFISMLVPIGATGAVGTLDVDDPGMSISRASQGVYNVVFPTCPAGRIHVSIVKSAARTIISAFGASTPSFTAGTWQFHCVDAAGAATDPANGDILLVELIAFKRAD